jgi:hypothetical protein
MFQRGNDRVICQLDRGRAFTLSLQPLTGGRRRLIARFDDAVQAFQRHAQIAAELRQIGWTVASYSR